MQIIDNTLTDEELHKLLMQEMLKPWVTILTSLWTAFDKKPTSEMVEIYTDQLGEIPLELLKLVVKRAIRDHKFGNVPNVHDVWEALRRELELSLHDDLLEGIEQWKQTQFERILVRFPVISSVSMETEGR